MKFNSLVIRVLMDTPIAEKSKPKFDLLIEYIVQPIVKHVYQLATQVIQMDLDI